jgi:hypothetical protein
MGDTATPCPKALKKQAKNLIMRVLKDFFIGYFGLRNGAFALYEDSI